MYDAFVGYLDLHTKSTFHNYNDCKQTFKNIIFNCLFEISRQYKNDTNIYFYNNKLNECLEAQYAANIPYSAELQQILHEASTIDLPENKKLKFTELMEQRSQKNSTNYNMSDMGDSNFDCLLIFFETVTLLDPSIITKIYYKSSSNDPDRNNPLKPFFDLNYYDCIIYIEKGTQTNRNIFSKSFFQIESEFNNNLSMLYEINSIIVPCGNHVVAFNTEMCGTVKKYFYYNNMVAQSKVTIIATDVLDNKLLTIGGCNNATIIATKKTLTNT